MGKWKKIQAGVYWLEGTEYAVASGPKAAADPDGPHADRFGFVHGVEWAAIKGFNPRNGQEGENLDWFDTMREARAECERIAS